MKKYEAEIIKELISASGLKNYLLDENAIIQSLEYTACGYFLTVKDANLPIKRIVLNRPHITGRLGEIDVGFLAFVENHMLTLECYTYGDVELFQNLREETFERET